MTTWLQNDPLFREQVSIGHRYEEIVAEELRSSGLSVVIKPKKIRDHVSQRHEYQNEHDLVINQTVVAEVKSRDLWFVGPRDYPYPSAIVDDVVGWDAKATKATAVILVSQYTHGLAVVSAKSQPHWFRRYKTDHVRGISYWAYHVDAKRLRPIGDFVSWCLSRR